MWARGQKQENPWMFEETERKVVESKGDPQAIHDAKRYISSILIRFFGALTMVLVLVECGIVWDIIVSGDEGDPQIFHVIVATSSCFCVFVLIVLLMVTKQPLLSPN